MDLGIERKNLIEELGVHLEGDHLAPLAARILATLILSGKKGVTFEELVNELNAGKSTVSTHLDHLQNTNRVTYFTKPGERKRYFIIDPNLILNVMEEMLNKWEKERKLHIKIRNYKEESNLQAAKTGDFQFDLEFQEDYLTFLNETSTAVQKLKTRLLARYNEN
ncbi:MAG: transcriptional regulator [Salinimicrobium sediminis]|uniref:DNA-binding transcriptional regulator GbsR, MarR family n=1 Tax=Salinimicrobium sediminis TaxID=1343891 RepID=A0A285X1I8_9FLAO|nr:transcriptional regulator [Salinimicrobium sediminis]MDX1602973.1 transcriptional regulator [Salinimicrobium sediminis]MDX1752332.1 transcriptional regulator [Salinimicrobium sediminis]SOC79213.1 DNA-binding transcriptional regulator GbsR, MarR family [Salinimicrobium sediminis]